MKKSKLPLLAAMAAATALAATVTAAPAGAKTTRASALSCSKTLQIGMMAPLTGAAGFLGQEQLSWAKLAIKTLPQTMGLKVKLVTGDAPVEQGPSAAQTVAQKFIANKNLVARPASSRCRRPRRARRSRRATTRRRRARSSASSLLTTTRARRTPTS